MFGFSRKEKPHSALDEFIIAVYGNPPPPKRADVGQATMLAFKELLLGIVNESEVRQQANELESGPIPYSTHDLALSVALVFFKRPEYKNLLHMAQINTRVKMLEWLQARLVAPVIATSFEDVLYNLYK